MAKYLKGFSAFSYFPVTEDTTAAYTATPKTPLVGAQSLSPSDTRNDFKIDADDGVYDQGSDYDSTELVVTVAEMALENLAELTGATYDETEQVMTEKDVDIAPPVALTFRALLSNGGYRLYKYYACKLTGYKVSHKTRGSDSAATYELTFKAAGRGMDGFVRDTKDIALGDPQTWLDTITA